jgi:hypothetical protein
MKNATAMKPLKSAIEYGREEVTKRMATDRQVVLNKKTLFWIGAGLLALAVSKMMKNGWISMECVKDARRAAEQKLDNAIEDTMDASDAISKY